MRSLRTRSRGRRLVRRKAQSITPRPRCRVERSRYRGAPASAPVRHIQFDTTVITFFMFFVTHSPDFANKMIPHFRKEKRYRDYNRSGACDNAQSYIAGGTAEKGIFFKNPPIEMYNKNVKGGPDKTSNRLCPATDGLTCDVSRRSVTAQKSYLKRNHAESGEGLCFAPPDRKLKESEPKIIVCTHYPQASDTHATEHARAETARWPPVRLAAATGDKWRYSDAPVGVSDCAMFLANHRLSSILYFRANYCERQWGARRCRATLLGSLLRCSEADLGFYR
ncbi:hypothetical protein EVAR_15959_1 [Eumeta japonica]|uniref:Uncharacterized protein n=1 Tax=Eumeta variegata TaxID=151549 RepID=A0A4C1UMH3_EUMVA|nr:hypothetical protein EVAR_15959_1 [Eumeta japonica]